MKSKLKDPTPVRDDLQEKAPASQKGDKYAGLQPDAQDAGQKEKPKR